MQNKNKNTQDRIKQSKRSTELKRESLIVAYTAISESELFLAYKNYHYTLPHEDLEEFNAMLWSLGLDTTLPYTVQENVIHRNRLNQVHQCNRFLGEERQDKEWLESGYASTAALDKASKNKILEDLYRSRSETRDTQAILEAKDIYTEVDKTLWIEQEDTQNA